MENLFHKQCSGKFSENALLLREHLRISGLTTTGFQAIEDSMKSTGIFELLIIFVLENRKIKHKRIPIRLNFPRE